MANYNATFTSVWDDGIEISSRCYASKRTHRITRMGKNDVNSSVENSVETLEREYVTLDTGEEYPAVPADEMENYEEEVFGY